MCRTTSPLPSVSDSLIALAARGEDFQLLLDRYAVERFLYRLSISDVRDEFLLKGALLFTLWFNAPHRPTRDADFLGYGPRDAQALAETVRRICAIECEDGIVYDPDSIKVVEIRENATYQGCASRCVRNSTKLVVWCSWTWGMATQLRRDRWKSPIRDCSMTSRHQICAPTREKLCSPKNSRQSRNSESPTAA